VNRRIAGEFVVTNPSAGGINEMLFNPECSLIIFVGDYTIRPDITLRLDAHGPARFARPNPTAKSICVL